jgi:hypothetical protein
VSVPTDVRHQLARLQRVFEEPLADGSPGYRDFITAYGPQSAGNGMEDHLYRHDAAWCERAAERTATLFDFVATVPGQDFVTGSPGPPRPNSDLRVTPHF